MEGRSKELYDKLAELENKILEGNFNSDLKLQSQESDIDRLRNIIDELKAQERLMKDNHKNRFDTFDETVSATSEKLLELSLQLDNVEKRLTVLEEHKSSSDKRVWSYVEKVIIAVISGIMTLLFNSL